MITGKQVSLLEVWFGKAGIYGHKKRLDWLFDHEIDIPQLRSGRPEYEAMSRDDLQLALHELGYTEEG